ncbi:MAG: hypothetical protein AB1730_15780 [Myxococcota bacterium]
MPSARTVALGPGGAAVVSLAAGVGLGASGVSQSNSLSALGPDDEAKAAAVNGQALGAAAGLAVATVVTWFVGNPAPATA